MFKRLFIEHPKSVDEGYFEHMGMALSFAGAMFVGSMACLVHALVPGLCVKTGSGIINGLHQRMVTNRTKTKPQDIKDSATA